MATSAEDTPISLDAIKGMLVKDLKAELEKRGASTNGKKAELIARLNDLIETEQLETAKAPTTQSNDTQEEAAAAVFSGPSPVNEVKDTGTLRAIAVVEEESMPIDAEQINPVESFKEAAAVSEIEDSTCNDAAVAVIEDATDSTKQIESKNEKNDDNNINTEFVVENSAVAVLVEAKTSEDALDIATDIAEKVTGKRKAEDITDDHTTTGATTSAGFLSVRIDYFQRPLNLKGLLQWLQEICGCSISGERIWINAIKTHCYVDFNSAEEAQNCIQRVTGQRFPETNTNLLVASPTAVSAKDAPSAAEAALKPGEWKKPSQAHQQQQQSNKRQAQQKLPVELLPVSTTAATTAVGAVAQGQSPRATAPGGIFAMGNLFKRAAVDAFGRPQAQSVAADSTVASSDSAAVTGRSVVMTAPASAAAIGSVAQGAAATGSLSSSAAAAEGNIRGLAKLKTITAADGGFVTQKLRQSMKADATLDNDVRKTSNGRFTAAASVVALAEVRRTRSTPVILWQPVAESLVQQRMRERRTNTSAK